MKFKSFLLKLFPFLSRFIKQDTVSKPVEAPVIVSQAPQAAPLPSTPSASIVAVSTAPAVPASTAAYMGGGTQVNTGTAVPDITDHNGNVLEYNGSVYYFGPGTKKYIMPKVVAGKGYLLSVADAAGEVHVAVSYSDMTAVPGASFIAENALTQEFTVDRNDDLTVLVVSPTTGTIERHDAAA